MPRLKSCPDWPPASHSVEDHWFGNVGKILSNMVFEVENPANKLPSCRGYQERVRRCSDAQPRGERQGRSNDTRSAAGKNDPVVTTV